MGEEDGYKTSQSSINRLKNKGQYDYATVHSLLDACPVLHVSFNDPTGSDPFPIILPMLGATGSFSDQGGDPGTGPRDIYLHGHSAARMFRAPTTSGQADEGFPMCVAATFMDGLVLSYTAFHNSCNYRSAVAYGRAVPVADEAERDYALGLITNNILPGRWEDGRSPSKPELTSTAILRLRIQSASAKIGASTANEERKDLKDDELRARTWVGVIPTNLVWGTPVPSADNRAAKLPEYITKYVGTLNEEGKKYAEAAATPKEK